MKLDIVSMNYFPREERLIRKAFRLLKNKLSLENTYVEVYIVDDDYTVHSYEPDLHIRRFDVRNLKVLGDIYISPRFIKQHPLTSEGYEADFVFFLIHGLLHLLGHDHAHKDDLIVMEREEEMLWRFVMTI